MPEFLIRSNRSRRRQPAALNTENWKNEIDSIKIPKGLKVTGWSYPDYQGTKYGPYQGPSDILRVKDQNDWDSMKIERIE